MVKLGNRRRLVFANRMHQEIMVIIFLSLLLPSMVVAAVSYYLIFGITASEIAIPEAIAASINPAARKVLFITLVSLPFFIILLLMIAYKITHKIVGPYNRIIKELDERIKSERKQPIMLRKNDKFKHLVERINKLLKNYKGGQS